MYGNPENIAAVRVYMDSEVILYLSEISRIKCFDFSTLVTYGCSNSMVKLQKYMLYYRWAEEQ